MRAHHAWSQTRTAVFNGMGTDNQIQSRVRAALEAAGEQYEIMPCDPALADTEDFCRHYGIPPENSANTILVKAKTGGERFAACVLLADSKLDVNRCVRKRLGARRVSFASADETRALTGMTLGGVTPLGLPGDMPLWVDSRLMNADYVILGAGVREAKIKVAPSVFRRLPNAEVVEGLAIPRS